MLAAAADAESVTAGTHCPAGAPVRSYMIAAINVDITLDRYLDHDPQRRMYALEAELPLVRAEEAQNARASGAEPAVSIGLQGDAVQPLTLHVNQGECLRVTLRNALEQNEPATFHLHGSSLHLRNSGAAAIATNAEAVARPGQSVAYEWFVAPDEPERSTTSTATATRKRRSWRPTSAIRWWCARWWAPRTTRIRCTSTGTGSGSSHGA
ncbi:MAG: hypothetical protein EXR68_06370 [Dehalococcoidia bacterium]|nr:hypothetical protein [Dehalococcoidia bacterium]